MAPNPLLGIPLHWIGGFASGSFYTLYRQVRRWSWETYWLVGGCFAWVIMPWLGAWLLTENLFGVLHRASWPTLLTAACFGALWGFGSLTAGLSIRFLGLSLGQGITLGFCAAFGTLVPPLYEGRFETLAKSASGQMVLLGIAICLLGIGVAAAAGISKERDLQALTAAGAPASSGDFRFAKGLLVAVFAGIMSSFFAFGLVAAEPLAAFSAEAGTASWWTGLPKIVVVLLGGFVTNAVCCLYLNFRNRSTGEYTGRCAPESADEIAQKKGTAYLARNYVACAAAGTTWYLQFFFYTMGETQMGRFQFSSWTLHMASIILFSTLWGWILAEWKGTSPKTRRLIGTAMALLVVSTLVVGYGNYLGTRTP